MIYFPIFKNEFYIFLSVFISLLILTWNFPYLSKFGYTRPIYFEDLIKDDKSVVKKKIMYNIELSKKFKNRFLIFQQFILSITIAVVVEYINLKYELKDYQAMEFLGLIGGIFSLYAKIIRSVGKLILTILYYCKKREKENLLLKLKVKPSSSFTNLQSLDNLPDDKNIKRITQNPILESNNSKNNIIV